MKLQVLTASVFVLLGVASLACSAPDDEILMGNDGNAGNDANAGSGGSSAGTQSSGSDAGKSSGGMSPGGSSSGGSSSNAGRPSGGNSAAGSGAGGTDPAPYDPCAGKACGDLCSLCDPAEPNCVEPTVIMTCTATGQCSVGRPACTVPACEGTQQYYAPGCDQLARPDPNALMPFEPGCYDACSAAGACRENYTCTSVWYDPSANCPPGGGCIAACGGVIDICIQN